MMEAIAPQNKIITHENVNSNFNRGVISNQELSDVCVDFKVSNVCFEAGSFNDTSWTAGGDRVQFSRCIFHNCTFVGDWSHIDFYNCQLDDLTFKHGNYTHLRIIDGEMTIFTTDNIFANNFSFIRTGVKKFLMPSPTVFASKASQFVALSMHDCRMRMVIQSTSFDKSTFMSCTFTGYFKASKLLNTNMKKNKCTQLLLHDNTIANCDITGCNFDKSDWRKTTISHSNFMSTTFKTSDMNSTTMNYCQFINCPFFCSTFEKSTLCSIHLTDCDLSHVNMTRGSFRDITLESVIEYDCNWKESSLTNISRSVNSSLSGRLFFNDKKSAKRQHIQFKLTLYTTNSEIAPICFQTDKPLAINTHNYLPYISFKIPPEYEHDIDFIHVKCSDMSLWTRLFTYSIAPLYPENYVSYIQLGRKIFYFREDPDIRTGTCGFKSNKKLKKTTKMIRTYSA